MRSMQRFNFSYDEENDDLFLYNPKSRSKGSVELGDIILDFNNKKELVGLQIMGASRLIKELVGESINGIRSILSDLKECRVDAKVKSNLLIIKMCLLSRSRSISPVIPLPSIRKRSPALAYG